MIFDASSQSSKAHARQHENPPSHYQLKSYQKFVIQPLPAGKVGNFLII